MVRQGCEANHGHLLADLVYEDAGRRQGSRSNLGSLKLRIHKNELLDEEMASTCHGISLREHLSEAIPLAIDLEAKPILNLEEANQRWYEPELSLLGCI